MKQWNYLVSQKINKQKKEKVPSLEVVEVVLVQCNLVDNQIININKRLKYYTLLLQINLMLICKMLNQVI